MRSTLARAIGIELWIFPTPEQAAQYTASPTTTPSITSSLTANPLLQPPLVGHFPDINLPAENFTPAPIKAQQRGDRSDHVPLAQHHIVWCVEFDGYVVDAALILANTLRNEFGEERGNCAARGTVGRGEESEEGRVGRGR